MRYTLLRTPDGTILFSRSRHDYVTHTDKNGKEYMIDGGRDYTRRSANGDETMIEIDDTNAEDFKVIRELVGRSGYGKPGADDYGQWRFTKLCDMSDARLQAAIEYEFNHSHSASAHYQLLLREKLYRAEQEITITE